MAQRHIYVTLTNATQGREDDFNDWYTNHHMPEVVDKLPGFIRGRRYDMSPVQRKFPADHPMPKPWRYFGVYDLELDDIDDIDRSLEAVHTSGENFWPHNGSLDPGHGSWVFTPTGQTATGGTAIGADEHLLVVFTSPAPGREKDFSDWYADHLVEWVERGPGFVKAERFEANPVQRAGQSPRWQSLALYWVMADDLEEFMRREAEVSASGHIKSSGGARIEDYGLWLFTPMTGVIGPDPTPGSFFE
jgi:hypothetical protein